jgi:hypothetical protein
MNNMDDQLGYYSHSEDLGNFVVLDVSKKNFTYSNKRGYYLKTNIESLKSFLEVHETLTLEDIQTRTDYLKTILVKFFKEPQLEEEYNDKQD